MATEPFDCETSNEALRKLSQRECLVTMDELMSRRASEKDLKFMVRLWRQDRLAWGDARDKKESKGEE